MQQKDIDYTALDYSLFKNSYKSRVQEATQSDNLKAQAAKAGAEAAKVSIDDYKKDLASLQKQQSTTNDPEQKKALDLRIKQKQLQIKSAEAESKGL